MKTLIITILLTGIITTSCSAQKKIATLPDNVATKAMLETYLIKKEQKKVTIENSKNKFANIKQSSPNLPINIAITPYYFRPDLKELTMICARNITLKELENLATNKYAGLTIDLRTTVDGKVLELSFFTDDTSILNLQQLENIEHEIKANNPIIIRSGVEAYVKGSNFLRITSKIYFDDMLKVKKTL